MELIKIENWGVTTLPHLKNFRPRKLLEGSCSGWNFLNRFYILYSFFTPPVHVQF